MLKGRVRGRYWSSRRLASFPQGPLLEVEMANGQGRTVFQMVDQMKFTPSSFADWREASA